MDTDRFDRLTRAVSTVLSRRGLASALGLAAIGRPGLAAAKKKKKKLKKNAFGCVNVGNACRGNSANCCSGICQGKKPKKGKKDKSTCVAHDEGGCQADQDSCAEGVPIPCPDNGSALCNRTTGNASFCGNNVNSQCVVCAKDADCAAGFGVGAACIVCVACVGEVGTACVPPGV